MTRAFSALACVVLGGMSAWADGPPGAGAGAGGPRRPEAAGRVVRLFDFEERGDPSRPDFNPEPVPRHWVRAQHTPPERERPGFPLGNKAGYDTSAAHGGKVSIRLPTSGGSTALRLGSSLLPVFPNTDYAVSAWVKTAGLRHARAFLTAQFTDARGEAIAGATARSVAIGEGETGQWREVVVPLAGRWPGAAFVQVELLLLQPEQFEARPLSGKHHVWAQDFDGSAWFDDVAVMQMPRVELRAGPASGIAAGSGPGSMPGFSLRVQDLTGETIEGVLTLRDIDDQVVATTTRLLGAGGGRFDWNPALPAYGWYEASVELRSLSRQSGARGEGAEGAEAAGANGAEGADAPTKTVVGRARCAVVWGPPGWEEGTSSGGGAGGAGSGESAASAEARRVRSRFGLVVDGLTPAQDGEIEAFASSLGVGRVSLVLPEADGAAGGAEAGSAAGRLERLKAQVDPLLKRRFGVEFRMPTVPEDLARANSIDPGDPLALLELEPAKWMPSLRDVLDVFGQRVVRWSVGSGRDHATLLRADLPERVNKVRAGLSRSIPGPVVVIPWRADWAWPAAGSGERPRIDALSINVPSGLSLPAVSEVAGQWVSQRGPGVGIEAVIEPLPVETFGRRAAVEEMAKRAAVLWETLDPWGRPGGGARSVGEVGLGIRQPWTALGMGEAGVFEPEATVAVWRTLVSRLGPRRVAGRLPASPGVTCMVLVDAHGSEHGPGRGALLMWSDGSDASASVSAYLGDAPLREVDLFGNERPLPAGRPGMPRRLAVGPSPVFVEGINEHLALFIEGLRLEPNFVDADASEHEHVLLLRNPWPVRVTGEVQLAAPQGSLTASTWRFSPTAPMPFALAPGETARLPITFSFSAAEEAGPATISTIVRLTAGKVYPPMALGVPIRIGLRDLDMTPSLILAPTSNGPDVIVTATISNTGSRSRTLQIEALAGGFPAQQQTVSNLAPGEAVVRRFVFRDAAQRLAGRRVRIMVSDAEGSERLNRSVVVP